MCYQAKSHRRGEGLWPNLIGSSVDSREEPHWSHPAGRARTVVFIPAFSSVPGERAGWGRGTHSQAPPAVPPTDKANRAAEGGTLTMRCRCLRPHSRGKASNHCLYLQYPSCNLVQLFHWEGYLSRGGEESKSKDDGLTAVLGCKLPWASLLFSW